jgi:ATP-dependent helicase/nuclease subunit B
VRALARHAELLAAGGEIVTASARQSEALTLALGRERERAGESVWDTPRIVPYGAWLERAALRLEERPALLEPAAASRLWQRIVADSPAGARLISARAAAADAERAFQLLADWCLAPADLDAATAERAAFRDWVRAFMEECRRQGMIDRARLPALIAAQAQAALGAEPRALGWHGFAHPTPARRALAAALGALGRPSAELALDGGPAALAFAGAETPEDELALIANWAAAHLGRDPDARLGVLAPGLGARAARLARLLDDRLAPGLKQPGAADARPYAIGAGRTLGAQPLIDTALALLTLGEPVLDVLTVGRVLRSPYLAPAGEGLERTGRMQRGARLDAKLRALGPRELPSEVVLKELRRGEYPGGTLSAALAEARRALAGQRRRAAADWGELIPRALRAAGWPLGGDLSASEALAADGFYELIGTFTGLGRVLAPLTLAEARAELAALAGAKAFEPERGAPLVVLDTLADPGVPVDGLWVAGLTAERFPGPALPNPFLPPALQRALGMPAASAELALAEARAALDGWRRATPELVLSAPLRDGELSLLRSGLVPELPAYAPPGSRPLRAAEIHAARALEPWREPGLPPLAPGLRLEGGVRVLERQSECPFRAGAELRLGAQALETPGTGFPRRIRGLLMHAALAVFWRGLGTQAALAAAGAGGRAQRAAEAVEAAFDGARGELPGGMLAELERRWMGRALLALAEYELGRAPFTVLEIERGEELVLDGRALSTRLDRLDRLADGALVLLDYKTGRSAPRRWLEQRPDALQLAVYAAFRPEPPQAIAVARLPLSLSKKFVGVAAREGLLPTVRALRGPGWGEQLAQWRATAERLAREFAAGRAEVDPVDGACAHCPHAMLCRIEERSLGEDDAAAASGDEP